MHYTERLSVPASHWGIALFFGLTFISAVALYAGTTFTLLATGLATVAIAWFLMSYGRVEIRVDERGLLVGRSLLEWPYVGAVVVHDAAGTKRRLGIAANRQAFLSVRGYLAGSVEVEVIDPADPHPYWLISSRHPADLAAGIAAARASQDVAQ
ncbi:MAG: DUF3093 domain-containing protein [Micropruina sp.]|nr:DUF3093 domain-containing protein [Micropruina sp.]